MQQFKYTVTAEDAGRRLDALLPDKMPGFSRSQVHRAITQGRVRVNGKHPKPSLPAVEGDLVDIDLPEPVPLEAQAEAIALDVLYEDDWLIVINKPSGMVVHPACGNYSGTLVNALLHRCDDLSGIGGVIRPGIVHRLDKGTSGVLVAAKKDEAHRRLSDQFKEHTVTRRYHALVFGGFSESAGTIESEIGRHVSDRKKMSTRTGRGRRAVTHWRVLESYRGVTLIEASLETGRTHQVRVHLSSVNHTVVGDDLYGADKKLKQVFEKRVLDLLRSAKRPLLHAFHLAFAHPGTGAPMTFETPEPSDFSGILDSLRSMHA